MSLKKSRFKDNKMTMTKNRLSLLIELADKKFMYQHSVKDKRSMNWLCDNDYISCHFSMQSLQRVAAITQKGIDYIDSLAKCE